MDLLTLLCFLGASMALYFYVLIVVALGYFLEGSHIVGYIYGISLLDGSNMVSNDFAYSMITYLTRNLQNSHFYRSHI